MSTQEKKSALKIGWRKSTENGIPKSLVIWVSPSNSASWWNRPTEKNICKVKKTENCSNEYSRKEISSTNRLSKVKENEIYGIPKSLVIWVSPSNMASKWNRATGKNSAEFT